MVSLGRLRAKLSHFNSNSLQLRLTVGVALVSALGLGSVVSWFSWRMERELLVAHEDNVAFVGERLPEHIEMYQEVYPFPDAVQRSLERMTERGVQLWIANERGDVTWHSTPTPVNAQDMPALLSPEQPWPVTPGRPQVAEINGRYWVACAMPLSVGQQSLGTVYIAEDINANHLLFARLIRNLGIAGVVSVTAMTVLLTLYVRRSLAPLQEMCDVVDRVSAEQLHAGLVQLEDAPSEVQHLAQAYDRMLVRLSESWEQQRQFISNASHELRTPLAIVSGYLQSTLRRGGNLTDMQKEALLVAAAETDRTVQLLGDLLTLARADNGHMHFQFERIDLDSFLNSVIAMVKQGSTREIHLDLHARGLTVRADRDKLKQALMNLLDNALKYSEAGEPVILSLTVDSTQGTQACIQVCDRGRGIPLADQARIFERFYRVDEARARSMGGTGLGLAIVKTLIEGMDGAVTVASKPDEGSTFTVTLPAQQASARAFVGKKQNKNSIITVTA
ncbi:MAG: HAMP domain-containing sensor histidine kinase [Cyanobacteria bacterium J06641_5]